MEKTMEQLEDQLRDELRELIARGFSIPEDGDEKILSLCPAWRQMQLNLAKGLVKTLLNDGTASQQTEADRARTKVKSLLDGGR